MPNKTVKVTAEKLENFKIDVKAGDHVMRIDQPANGGGEGTGPSPLHYMFAALSGCVITIGTMVARQKRLDIRNFKVEVEGEINTDGLMGKASEDRIGFKKLVVKADIDADMTDEEKMNFLHEVDKRCPISDNIFNTTPIDFKLK